MFIDYEEPFSRRGLQTVQSVAQKFPGKIKYSVRYNALDYHPCSKLMAISAIAASRQEKFWSFSQELFSDDFMKMLRSGGMPCRTAVSRAAKVTGLDVAWFDRDLSDPSIATLVDRDTATADLMGIGVPTFFINGVIVPGAYPQKHFEDIIYRLEPQLRST